MLNRVCQRDMKSPCCHVARCIGCMKKSSLEILQQLKDIQENANEISDIIDERIERNEKAETSCE